MPIVCINRVGVRESYIIEIELILRMRNDSWKEIEKSLYEWILYGYEFDRKLKCPVLEVWGKTAMWRQAKILTLPCFVSLIALSNVSVISRRIEWIKMSTSLTLECVQSLNRTRNDLTLLWVRKWTHIWK